MKQNVSPAVAVIIIAIVVIIAAVIGWKKMSPQGATDKPYNMAEAMKNAGVTPGAPSKAPGR